MTTNYLIAHGCHFSGERSVSAVDADWVNDFIGDVRSEGRGSYAQVLEYTCETPESAVESRLEDFHMPF